VAMVTPETQALKERTRQLRDEIHEDIRELQRLRREQESARPRVVVSTSVALVSLLGLILILVAGLAGLSSGALTGIAALVLGVAVILGDRPSKRGT
jgi:Flp pilus assembly protein TadB